MKFGVFLHIPKCGGSTVRDEIVKKYEGQRLIKIYHDNPSRDYYSVASFLKTFERGLPQYTKAIVGHITYKEILPLIADHDCHVFSLVRDPLERIISDLNFLRVSKNHPGHIGAMSISPGFLYNYLKSVEKNFQYNYLGGHDYIQNVKVYKLENYKSALIDAGIIDSLNDNVVKQNVTVKRKFESETDTELLSLSMLNEDELSHLRTLFSVDYDLYNKAV